MFSLFIAMSILTPDSLIVPCSVDSRVLSIETHVENSGRGALMTVGYKRSSEVISRHKKNSLKWERGFRFESSSFRDPAARRSKKKSVCASAAVSRSGYQTLARISRALASVFIPRNVATAPSHVLLSAFKLFTQDLVAHRQRVRKFSRMIYWWLFPWSPL